jgi:hypothetical protein
VKSFAKNDSAKHLQNICEKFGIVADFLPKLVTGVDRKWLPAGKELTLAIIIYHQHDIIL